MIAYLYTAIPGIVTGFGLLFTFIAILFALLDVKLANKQFTGLDKLVSGLSGKFLSSIAALLAATIFLFCEKWFLHNLTKSLHELVVALDALVPRLTSAHLLNEIRSYMEEQSTAFKHFNSDLSIKLKQGVEEGMGPTRDRMVGAIEELNQVLRAVEAQKSVTRNLSQIATQTSAMVAAAAGSTKAIQEAGVAIEHVAQLAASQIESFRGIIGSMQRYDEIFGNVQDTAGKLLVQIDQHLRGYQQTTKDGYEKLTILVNSSLADATSKLGATVNELDEHLQDLTEILGRVRS